MAITRVVNRGTLLEIDASDIDTSYVAIGQLSGAARSIKFKGYLNGDVYLTYDPTQDQMWFPSGLVGQVEDHTSNSPANADVWEEPKGRTYYIRWDSAPSSPSGKFFIETNVPQSGV